MRIYLAGPSAEIERVKEAAMVIEDHGHTVAEPWWGRIEEARRCGWERDADVPDDFMRESAQRNERGIDRARAMIVLCQSGGGLSSGASGELGLWRGFNNVNRTRPHAWVVGNHGRHVMTWSDVQRVADVNEALRGLALWLA